MKRRISLCIAILLVLSVMCGCNKMPAVDENIKPEAFLSQYKTLTELYGTPWRDALKSLDIDLQEINADGLANVGIPLQETYAGITFDVSLRFGGADEHLRGIEYTVEYSYPEAEAQLLKDLVKINRSLISDFGDPSDTSFVFNWAEKKLGEKWNRDIAYWQDSQVLKRLLDSGCTGTLLLWNLDSIAPDNIKALGIEHSLSIYVSVYEDEGVAFITINY